MESPKGFIRDRINQIISIRNSYKDNFSKLPDNTGNLADDTIIHYSFEIETQFQDILSKLDSLKGLYKRSIESISFFTDEDQSESDIASLTDQITKQLTNLKNKVKGEDLIQAGPEAAAMFSNMRKGYLARIRTILIQFRKMQSSHLNQLNEIKLRAQKSSELETNPVEFEDIDVNFTNEQNQMIQDNSEEILERNRMIDEVTHLMEEIKPLFLDLDSLIQDQGLILDRIDHNIDQSLQEVSNGNKQLAQAEKDQSSKCFFVYLISMIFLIIILGSIIIIKKEMKHKK